MSNKSEYSSEAEARASMVEREHFDSIGKKSWIGKLREYDWWSPLSLIGGLIGLMLFAMCLAAIFSVSAIAIAGFFALYGEFGPIGPGVVISLIITYIGYRGVKHEKEWDKLASRLRQTEKELVEKNRDFIDEKRRREEYEKLLTNIGYFNTPEYLAHCRELELKVAEVKRRLNLP